MANQYPKVNLFIENTYNFNENVLSKFLTSSIINEVISTLPEDKDFINSLIDDIKKEI